MPELKLVEQDSAFHLAPFWDAKILTIAEMDSWVLPPFQRQEHMNQKIIEFAEQLKSNGGMISGVITLGVLPNDQNIYLVDAQQRRAACRLAAMPEFIGDIRLKHYSSMADMAEDFKRINSHLVAMRPDDLLRAYETTHLHLKHLRERCPFIGYDNVRRAESRGALLGMSATLRSWFASGRETPTMQARATELVDLLDGNQVDKLSVFLLTAYSAWGADPEYYRLWSGLNLTLCMWLYRQLVIDPQNRRPPLSMDMFRKCLMSASARPDYLEWLVNRNLTERDRSPCYNRLKGIFSRRLTQEFNGRQPKLPAPPWASKSGSRS